MNNELTKVYKIFKIWDCSHMCLNMPTSAINLHSVPIHLSLRTATLTMLHKTLNCSWRAIGHQPDPCLIQLHCSESQAPQRQLSSTYSNMHVIVCGCVSLRHKLVTSSQLAVEFIKMRVARFWRQVCLLLWKNAILKIRQPVSTMHVMVNHCAGLS